MVPSLLPLLTFVVSVSAFWRMPCSSFPGSNRIDPIVSPNNLAAHSHVIWGSTGVSLNSGFAELQDQCTTCAVEQDKSAYWVPSLYFRYDNGTYVEVGRQGQPLVYYTQDNKKATAFPQGFRMVSGNPTWRDFPLPAQDPPTSSWTAFDFQPETQARRSIGFNCLNYGKPTEPSFMRHALPTKGFVDTCVDGLRGEKIFPACWDGKNLDSPDHQSHVAFPSLVRDGTCPDSHPVRLPQLIIEIIWWVRPFIGESGKFVFSTGDESGQSFHGDFLSGWDEHFLQQALDTCTDGSGMIEACPLFKVNYSNWSNCKYTPPKVAAVEACGSPRTELCGKGQAQPENPAPAPAPAPANPAPPAPAPPPPAVTPPAVGEAYGASPPSKAAVDKKVKVIYEVVTQEEWQTTTVYEKRSIPTNAPAVRHNHRRHALQHHHHHAVHARG